MAVELRRTLMLAGTSLFLAAAAAHTQGVPAGGAGEEAAAEEEEAAPAPVKKKGGSRDKAGIETYLKGRLARIKKAHKSRLDFNAREGIDWTNFWNKVKDERNLFEVRIARQRLDLFESLASLEAKEHQSAITDFEKLQNGVIRAFENQQKQKVAEFFSDRDKRFKEFAGAQEKERLDFAAEVDLSWQQLKAGMRAPIK